MTSPGVTHFHISSLKEIIQLDTLTYIGSTTHTTGMITGLTETQ